MIRVLIIEDNPEKLKRILDFLKADCSISDEDIDVADTVRSGREFLIKRSYDLLLLDLVLPVNEDSEATAESGANFLDEIHYNPNINIPVHIIGMTEFDSVFNDYVSEFEDKLWSLINFSLQATDWSDKLKSKIFYLQHFKSSYKKFIESETKYDVAIITALNVEFEELKSFADWEMIPLEDDPIVYYRYTINTKNNNNIRIVACSINQMGMQAAAAVTSKILSLFSPKKIFVTGICAGISSAGLKIGDIIIANQLWDYEAGKIAEDEDGNLLFKPDMKCITTDHAMLAKLTDFSNKKNFLLKSHEEFKGVKPDNYSTIKFGSVGSGPYVLTSKNYLTKLIETDRKLIGIDMEGYGVYKAAQYYSNVYPAFIKAVSDLGDADKHDNYHNYASYTSAKFTMDFIREYY